MTGWRVVWNPALPHGRQSLRTYPSRGHCDGYSEGADEVLIPHRRRDIGWRGRRMAGRRLIGSSTHSVTRYGRVPDGMTLTR